MLYIHQQNWPRMKNLMISPGIEDKLLKKHGVCRREVEQCFENREGKLLLDSREDHKTNPPTMWFLSLTNKGRLLKVVFIQSGLLVDLKTCYEPNEIEIGLYEKYGR